MNKLNWIVLSSLALLGCQGELEKLEDLNLTVVDGQTAKQQNDKRGTQFMHSADSSNSNRPYTVFGLSNWPTLHIEKDAAPLSVETVITEEKTELPPQALDVQTLSADEHFDFSIEKEISLSIQLSADKKGALHIYQDLGHILKDGGIIPDPRSRITTVYPEYSPKISLMINKNTPALYMHWLPTNINEEEIIKVLPLSQKKDYQITL